MSFFDFSVTADLLTRDFVLTALLVSALLGLVGGLLGPLVVGRQMAFAVHGAAELSVTGAAAAMLLGLSVNTGATLGAMLASIAFGLLGKRAHERDSVIGVLLAFGLGLAVLFIALVGRTESGFALLTGSPVSITSGGITSVVVTVSLVVAVLAVIYRPLLFASTDPVVAAARGVPVRTLSVIFAVLLGAAVAQSVQVIGALLVMSLLITPAAAAIHISASPVKVVVLAVIFAEVAAVGGVILSLAPGLPVSVFVTTISFVIYLVCRGVGYRRAHR